MLISTQKGVGGQELKWYKNELHHRGAKVPFKRVWLVPATTITPRNQEHTQSAIIMYTSFFIMNNCI